MYACLHNSIHKLPVHFCILPSFLLYSFLNLSSFFKFDFFPIFFFLFSSLLFSSLLFSSLLFSSLLFSSLLHYLQNTPVSCSVTFEMFSSSFSTSTVRDNGPSPNPAIAALREYQKTIVSVSQSISQSVRQSVSE